VPARFVILRTEFRDRNQNRAKSRPRRLRRFPFPANIFGLGRNPELNLITPS